MRPEPATVYCPTPGEVRAGVGAGPDLDRTQVTPLRQNPCVRSSGGTRGEVIANSISASTSPRKSELRQLALAHALPAYHWVCEHLDALTAAARNDPDRVRRHTSGGLRLAHRYRLLWAQGINTLTHARRTGRPGLALGTPCGHRPPGRRSTAASGSPAPDVHPAERRLGHHALTSSHEPSDRLDGGWRGRRPGRGGG